MKANQSQTAVVIVTHNSGKVIGACLNALAAQTSMPEQVIVIDSGSRDKKSLAALESNPLVSVLVRQENIGFSRANNIGMTHVRDELQYVLFLNPDIVLQKHCIDLATSYLDNEQGAGIITGRLQGYDFESSRPTGLLDSTGIFRKWYGRWYDRGQGEENVGQHAAAEDIPVACGALMFCRKKAILQAALVGGAVFDEDFFLYKEDIELCVRLRKLGWRIRYLPGLSAYHGRGWQGREKMTRELRRTAARSEVLLYKKHPSPYIFWALAKYFLVMIFDA